MEGKFAIGTLQHRLSMELLTVTFHTDTFPYRKPLVTWVALNDIFYRLSGRHSHSRAITYVLALPGLKLPSALKVKFLCSCLAIY